MALVTANLTNEWVAKLAAGAGPGVNSPTPTTTWVDNVGSNDITLTNTGGNYAWTTSSGWDGDGTAGDPYCLTADGTGDQGTFAAALVAEDADFTVELWTYLAAAHATNNQRFINHLASNTGLTYYVDKTTKDGSWSLGTGTGAAYATDGGGAGAGDGEGDAWQHHVLTYNATSNTAQAYRNGLATLSTTTAFAPNTSGTRTLFSGLTINSASIATMRVYSACLSSDDVAANYAAGVLAASTDTAFLPHVMCHHFIPQQLGGH